MPRTMKKGDGPISWFWVLRLSFLYPGCHWIYSTFWWTCIQKLWKVPFLETKQWFMQFCIFLECSTRLQILFFMGTLMKISEKNTEIYTGKSEISFLKSMIANYFRSVTAVIVFSSAHTKASKLMHGIKDTFLKIVSSFSKKPILNF